MQLALAQLGRHLQQGLRPLYTVVGDEILLQQEALDAIRAAARAQGFSERKVFIVSGAHFNWSEVRAAASEMSLFADKQIIDISIPSGKPGKEGSVALQTVAEMAAGNDGAMTLVSLPKLDFANTKSAWFSALDACGLTIKADTIDRRTLPAWLAQRLAAGGLRVEGGEQGQRTLAFFAERVEGNLLAAHQEIQKLALLYSAPQVLAQAAASQAGVGDPSATSVELSFEQVERAVLNVARYDVFKLTEAVLAGNAMRVQKMLDGLQAEGVAEVLVHYTLAEDIRALKRIMASLNQGKPLPMAIKENRIWGAKEQLMERAIPKLSPLLVDELLQSAQVVDGIVKGLRHPDWPTGGWQALQQLAMRLTSALR